MASCVMSSGGLTTLVWKKLGVKTKTTPTVQTSSITKTEGEKYESANAGK
jgi:hypothetical protein